LKKPVEALVTAARAGLGLSCAAVETGRLIAVNTIAARIETSCPNVTVVSQRANDFKRGDVLS
jgi:hypothetical protein